MHRIGRARNGRSLVGLVAAFLLAVSLAPVASHADTGWDFVYGDPGPANYSKYQVVRSAPDGSAYLAGFFTGTFNGLTATDVYRTFIQKINANGTIAWTQFGDASTATTLPPEPTLLLDGNEVLYYRTNPVQQGWRSLTGAGVTITAAPPPSSMGCMAGMPYLCLPIALHSGGLLTLYEQTPSRSIRRLDRNLVEQWSFDYDQYFDQARVPNVAEAPDGSIWIVGTKSRVLSTGLDALALVHVSSSGQLIAAIKHYGATARGTLFANEKSAVVAVGATFLWVTVSVEATASTQIWSLSSTDGSRLGEVPAALPPEQIPFGDRVLSCPVVSLTSSGVVMFDRQVLLGGSRLVLRLKCPDAASGGSALQVLVAYAADGPLGANMRRVAYRVLDPGATVAAMDADESGNVVVAGSTTSGLVYFGALGSAATMRTQAVGTERAVATRNPTGNLLKLPDFKALPPTRLVDTRPGAAQGAIIVTKQKYGGANTLQIRIAGVAGVPANGASAVALNVTVVSPDNAGYLTAYPCGAPPNVSNLNFSQNQTVPNAVIAPLSANGEVCFYASADTHLLVDVNGWFAT